MSNYLLTIDPLSLLNQNETSEFLKDKQNYQTTGQAADKLNQILQTDFPFAQVFQSTDENHKVMAHEFMLSTKTGDRKMHDMGHLQTPSNLMAFVTVDAKWLTTHKSEAKNGAVFKMDDRIDPHELHANDGATKDGNTTGFIRYGQYQTPVMALLPAEADEQDYKRESIQQQEDAANKREHRLRGRDFKLQVMHSAWREAKNGSAMDAFFAGWNMINRLNETPNKEFQTDSHRITTTAPHLPQMSMPGEQVTDTTFDKGLKELSVEAMENQDLQQ